MNRWKSLDLTRTFERPAPGQLTALRMVPKNDYATFDTNERLDIGRFVRDAETGKKLWWNGTKGWAEDPVRLKKKYDIWWCPVTEFDD